jgi:hypothetical protein
MGARLITVAALAAAALASLAPAASAVPPRGYELEAILTGPKEVPGPGDADGRGVIYLDMTRPRSPTLCYRLSYSYVDPLTAGHIHIGGPTVAGPVRVPLFTGAAPTGRRCVRASQTDKIRLMRNPGGWYVNLHNAPYPNGAIRGQIER